jgi:hypothetical protein
MDKTASACKHLTIKTTEGMHIEITLYLFDNKNKGLDEEALAKDFQG